MAKEKTKILLVEDDPFLLNMYATKFELEGFDVKVADDGEKGAKLALEECPDIILLDLILPKKDGFEVLGIIKSQEKTKNIPVILLTNLSQKNEIEKGMAMGAVDFFIKAHFMPSEVVAKIKKIIG